MSRQFFLNKETQKVETVDQGINTWINYPNSVTPGLFAAKAEIACGKGHNFHCHPGREELIFVMQGTIEQWIGESCKILSPGDAVVIPAGLAHASFNAGEDSAVLFVALTPTQLDDAPLAEDLSNLEPWNKLRTRNT